LPFNGVYITGYYYYVTVVIGNVMCLVRLFVGPYICFYLKMRLRKIQIGVNVYRRKNGRFADFHLKRSKVKVTARSEKKTLYISHVLSLVTKKQWLQRRN